MQVITELKKHMPVIYAYTCIYLSTVNMQLSCGSAEIIPLIIATAIDSDQGNRETRSPDPPWCWNLYHRWAINIEVNVGKYSMHGASGSRSSYTKMIKTNSCTQVSMISTPFQV